MLLLLTLLSIVAIHYYRDKQDRDNMQLLNETFASTINLADQSYVEIVRSVELDRDGSESPSVFIDTDMNGDVYYTNRNALGHLKRSMITKCGTKSPKSFFGGVQYPELVHSSDIDLGRRRQARPRRWKGSSHKRPKHLLPIPEITTEISENHTRVGEPEHEHCLLSLNKEQYSSVLNNPLMNSSSSKETELVEWKLDFVNHLLQNFTEDVQHLKKKTNGNIIALLNSNSSASDSASTYDLNSQCVVGNFSGHSSSFIHEEDSLELHNEDSRVKNKRTYLSNTVQSSPRSPEESGFHLTSKYVKNNKDLPLQIYNNSMGQIEMVGKHTNDYSDDEDGDTYSIDFEDVNNDSNDDKIETVRGAENLCSANECYNYHTSAIFKVSDQSISRVNSQKFPHNPNQNVTLNSPEGTGRQTIYFYVRELNSKNIAVPLSCYNKYHPGYSTVGHIKHKDKAQDSLHNSRNQKRKCRSCPNSPLQGSRSENTDVPMVTYIRSHPSLNVAAQSYTSTTGPGGGFHLSKYFNNEWEMRTIF